MKWTIAAVGVLTILAGCVLDRAGVTEGGGGAGAAGPGGGGQGGQVADPVCGDGIVNQAEEQCDEGPANTVNCDSDCTFVECGDGHLNQNAGESCDDGNTMNGDDCNAQCILESCGNGALDMGEECDDRNTNNNDDCLNNCNLPRCGDGVLHNEQSGTEQCDDGDGNNNDDCPDGANGTCLDASCGDGHVHDEETGNEQCDDSNNNQNDDCLNNCMAASCGDGHVHNQGNGNEQCDDSNNNNNDDCLNTCADASCGDGFVHNLGSALETCDDSNTNNNDGCSSVCDREAGYCCTGEPSACTEGPFTIGGMMLNDAIPPGGHPSMRVCNTFNFTQMGCGNIADVNVTVGIDHVYVSDVVVRLEGPDTTQQHIMNLPGDDNSNLGSTFPVTFDDEAPVSAITMGANIGGGVFVCQSSPCDYIPFPDPLSAYDGSSPVGPWTVCVSDWFVSGTGTVQSIDIEIATD